MFSADSNAGLLDEVRTQAAVWADTVRDKISPRAEKTAGVADADIVSETMPTGLPERWRWEFVTEPVFNSRMLVVEAGEAQMEAVVLVHGLGQLGFRDWLTVIPALEEYYHVIAFDLPGFGSSQVPAGRYSPENYAHVVEAVLAQREIEKAIIVGHSMGGAVALRFGALYPDRVTKLVLVDAAGILQRTAFIKHAAAIPTQPDAKSKLLKKARYYLKDVKDTLIEMSAATPDPTGFLNQHDQVWNRLFKDTPNANAALALIEEDFSADIQSLSAPVFIIWGEQDAVAPLRTGLLLAGRLAQAQLAVITGASHVPMKSHTEQFNQLLVAALAEKGVVPAPWGSQPDPAATEQLRCKDQVGLIFRGHYKAVLIENCVGVTLEEVVTESMRVVDSVVDLQRVSITSDGVALDAEESVVMATDVRIIGGVGVLSSGSRLDFAGASVQGITSAVEVTDRSRLVFSVSDLESPVYRGSVHGDYRVGHTSLDKVVATQ